MLAHRPTTPPRTSTRVKRTRSIEDVIDHSPSHPSCFPGRSTLQTRHRSYLRSSTPIKIGERDTVQPPAHGAVLIDDVKSEPMLSPPSPPVGVSLNCASLAVRWRLVLIAVVVAIASLAMASFTTAGNSRAAWLSQLYEWLRCIRSVHCEDAA